MPSISSRIVSRPPVSGPVSVTLPTPPVQAGPAPVQGPLPGLPAAHPSLSSFLRCPLPILVASPSDNLRQFYRGGVIPQHRFTPPPSLIG